MDKFKYTIEKLGKKHNKTSFNSGVGPLDRYIAQQASQDMKRHVAVTYVLSELLSNEVLGYYTLSATNIELNNLPDSQIKKLPRYPLLPATLIGRLAIDEKYQRKGIGQLLLIHALKLSLDNSDQIGSMAVIVDAKNDGAVQFYQHHGFIQFPDTLDKLFLLMETIKKMDLT